MGRQTAQESLCHCGYMGKRVTDASYGSEYCTYPAGFGETYCQSGELLLAVDGRAYMASCDCSEDRLRVIDEDNGISSTGKEPSLGKLWCA